MEEESTTTPPRSHRIRKCRTKSPKDTRWKRNQKRLSGYQYFLRLVLDELKERYPDHSIVLSEVSRLCAENWQNMCNDFKQNFQQGADTLNGSTAVLKKSAKPCNKKVKQQTCGPKRPLSAFILFCKEFRHYVKSTRPGLTMGQISTVLSIMWHETDQETKLKFQQMSFEQRERYRQEVKANKEAAQALREQNITMEMAKEIKIKIEVPEEEEEELQDIYNMEL